MEGEASGVGEKIGDKDLPRLNSILNPLSNFSFALLTHPSYTFPLLFSAQQNFIITPQNNTNYTPFYFSLSHSPPTDLLPFPFRVTSPLLPVRLTTPTCSTHHSYLFDSPLLPVRLTTPTCSTHHSYLFDSPLLPVRLTTPTCSTHHSYLFDSPLLPVRLTTPTCSTHHSYLFDSLTLFPSSRNYLLPTNS
ncbi:hypothetical protein Pmani_033536 [Petrolisthes manimaculis]|uniref:Uncharacterized protein n=1 Tax=Petrolisthes manimaculis TaxID=1843537 RepID=A0AAE1NPB2_9EUCA|nr:hypothetical protein Pmani_033536 [Petrolisthes manimaculis]